MTTTPMSTGRSKPTRMTMRMTKMMRMMRMRTRMRTRMMRVGVGANRYRQYISVMESS
jgi:hypothetical protein